MLTDPQLHHGLKIVSGLDDHLGGVNKKVLQAIGLCLQVRQVDDDAVCRLGGHDLGAGQFGAYRVFHAGQAAQALDGAAKVCRDGWQVGLANLSGQGLDMGLEARNATGHNFALAALFLAGQQLFGHQTVFTHQFE